MVSNFHLPPVGFGPGSQPEEQEELGYMQLPEGMRTYESHLPEVEDSSAVAPALKLLSDIAAACEAVAVGGMASFDLTGLDAQNRALIAETMGQGEVAMKIRGIPALMVQESVFAGVWNVAGAGVDRIEVANVPADSLSRAFEPFRAAKGASHPRGEGVVNAPALLAELLDKSASYMGGEPHVINLSLLPHTEQDLVWLDETAGEGAVTILSRGYGNCRITATALPHVWRVQFFNSMDALILDTFEVTTMPEVALAAREDLEDSAGRIREVLEAIR
ncbi:hydrogenase-1 operon protein HyaF [Rhodobacter aestuarii]|uniref:Hydrogenase-1 operon protein HyaF n=1 Tax=Rhodobacter aestuarii TaxID=453582 RepID=A0A1N7KZ03_9RHOB|nr:hydrogenase expression/formation protein [Rhodobacter aestuarii]PTV95492.1 hydrogenase-1 operon protein HyaF [Rhodobacter aestuarii]SIS66777.1 hydrogenase-1 operon protein HyaF [Rhodobacter aestuarii]